MRKLASLLTILVATTACQDGAPEVTAPDRGEPVLHSSAPVADLPVGPDVAPTFISFASYNNPTCSDLMPGSIELKINSPQAGSTVSANGVTVWVTRRDDDDLDWHADAPIDGVLIKAGAEGHNFYNYIQTNGPGAQMADDGLATPSGQEISHVSFCYTPRLQVSKTAETTFRRTYDWNIAKTSPTTSLILSPGQTYEVDYTITASLAATPSVDSDWAVSGVITITNSYDLTAIVTGVTDVVSPDVAAVVTCTGGTPSVAAPRELTQGQSLVCEYEAELPDAASRTNTATAVVSAASEVQGGSGTAAVTFASTTTDEYNECIAVSDDNGTPLVAGDDVALGTACVGDAPKTFEHSITIGPYTSPEQCGEQSVTNRASFVADAPGSDAGWDEHTVTIDVPCEAGCTLTQGYWKTHSHLGPAPYDAAWLNVGPAGSSTQFFSLGKTWYEVFWTPPSGNANYNLAHQYMAAKLNILDGASTTPAVDAAILYAETYFTSLGSLAAAPSGNLRKTVLAAASTLDRYNNGLIGPGHCSEQNP